MINDYLMSKFPNQKVMCKEHINPKIMLMVQSDLLFAFVD